MGVRLGIDTGGTFTDLIGLDDRGEIVVAKTPSTPAEPVRALGNALDASGVPPSDIDFLILGTTVATNALLQRQGADVLFLTTAGFEDVPYIQRMNRRYHYSLIWTKPKPLVKHRDCVGVSERIDARGRVVTALDDEALETLAFEIERRLDGRDRSRVAFAVCLLFSYINPEHELRLGEFLHERYPGISVSLSHQVAPIWREYERGSTVIADAYIKPTLQAYLGSIRTRLETIGMRGPWAVMKSNGGNAVPDAAEAQPVNLLLSGLSGGVIGGAYFGVAAGRRDVITLDMGGTSCDVGVVRDGQIGYSTNFEIEWGLPVAVPVVDLTTIGAGGGSIGWIDKGGFLRVGPRSAGAEPGPACYGLGGTEPTVTDANLVLGRIDPDYFLGGKIRLNREAADRAIGELGARLGLSPTDASQAMVDMANENMANAIRVLSIDRGLDPREFALVAFGGAGPLHGAALAQTMGMRQVVIPLHPGLCSAFGALIADLQVNKVHSTHVRSDEADAEAVQAHFTQLVEESIEELRQEGFEGTPEIQRSISMRYAGQNYEKDVPVEQETVTAESLQQIFRAFERLHEQFYGYAISGETVEMIRYNVTAIGRTTKPALRPVERGDSARPASQRDVWFPGAGWLATPIYRRDTLPADAALDGPAVVEEVDSTTLVHPGQRLQLDQYGIMTLTLSEEDREDVVTSSTTVEQIDSVTLSVINNAFVNVCREMGTAMMRTSYSTIFNEGLDFSCMLFNRGGDLIGQAEFCPTMLGSAQYAMKWAIDELGYDAFEPGDVIVHNDPYRGQCHMPEHLMMKPVFHEGELWGFVGTIAHVGEIGGMAPGSFAADGTEVYQEGLRLPPIKLISRGEYVKDLWKVILTNHRTPKVTWGDYHAMIGSLNVAESRLHELIRRYGADRLAAAADQLLDYSERFMRSEIEGIPDGVYEAEDCMEDDGITDKPYFARLKLTIKGDQVIADWRASDPQARGPINATFVVIAAATYSGFLHVISDDIPLNSGCYRPIKLVTTPGTLVNVVHPGPSVGGNTETHPKLQNIVLRALAQAVPDRVSAAEGATACNFLFGGVHPETGEYYTNYHIEGSGWGGTNTHDGNNVLCPENGNCRNAPVEVFDTKYPFLTKAFRLRPDSAGPGRWRGGLASSRHIVVTAPEITLSALMDRTKTRAWGLFGGGEGQSAHLLVKKRGDSEFRRVSEAYGRPSDSKFTRLMLYEGDEIILSSAGGGGYGAAIERPRELVAEDVLEGFVSAEAARRDYGFEGLA